MELQPPDAFVIAAYGLTALLLAGYFLSVLARRRETERSIAARTDVPAASADTVGDSAPGSIDLVD